MSAREQVQKELAEIVRELRWPDSGAPVFDAPYGVIVELNGASKGGYVRTITFGCRRTLDAIMYIWRPDNIVIEAHGPLAASIEGKYDSAESVAEAVRGIAGDP